MPDFFKRTALAANIGNRILSTAATSTSGSGVFLAAPRRTGKSTFLREDLRPQLEKQGALVLYVDLWENKQTDPGTAITDAIRMELAKHDGVLKRLAKSSGLDKLSVAGTTFSLDRLGLDKGISLTAALSALSDEVQKPIVLVIDEAQHSITTEGGINALFALKAARDELNSSRHHSLRVVATGSNQDKLAMLRNSKEQAFFGAPLVNFPPLDAHYVDWFVQNVGLPAPLDPARVMEMFKQASNRPEILGAAADTLRFDFEIDPADVPERFYAEVAREIENTNREALRVIHSLTPLQASVLQVLAEAGADYAPFEAKTLESYQHVLATNAPASEVKADIPNVQQALVALQEKNLVWKASRGVYALEDSSLADLLVQQRLKERGAPSASPVERDKAAPQQRVSVGTYSGPVIAISDDGSVTQRVNRDGTTVKHDAKLLSAQVAIGDSVDITYTKGVGQVTGAAQSKGPER